MKNMRSLWQLTVDSRADSVHLLDIEPKSLLVSAEQVLSA